MYRDDILWIIDGSGPDIERTRKKIVSIFKGCSLKLEDSVPISQEMDFLDVIFNLKDGTFRPYMKPGNEIKYVSTFSNHPPSIIRQIPKTVQDRISMLSSSEDIFRENIGPYQRAIENAGYQEKLNFDKEIHNRTGKKSSKLRLHQRKP